MKGQMTYNEITKSWTFTPTEKMTALIAGTRQSKIQSKDQYYKLWKDGKTYASTDLTELILMVQGQQLLWADLVNDQESRKTTTGSFTTRSALFELGKG